MQDVRLSLVWSADRQTFQFGDVIFVNEGPSKTDPSHDLAHLLIAANGGLAWRPCGHDAERRTAEYNAILLEHLMDRVYNSVMLRPSPVREILAATLRHARWFVDEHYAPFPVPAEEAYRQFCWQIDPILMVRLSPLFFDLKHLERTDPDCRSRGVVVDFAKQETPPMNGRAFEFADQVGALLTGIARPAA
jgi:hypothetical protein